jgi:hypothetical protein
MRLDALGLGVDRSGMAMPVSGMPWGAPGGNTGQRHALGIGHLSVAAAVAVAAFHGPNHFCVPVLAVRIGSGRAQCASSGPYSMSRRGVCGMRYKQTWSCGPAVVTPLIWRSLWVRLLLLLGGTRGVEAKPFLPSKLAVRCTDYRSAHLSALTGVRTACTATPVWGVVDHET